MPYCKTFSPEARIIFGLSNCGLQRPPLFIFHLAAAQNTPSKATYFNSKYGPDLLLVKTYFIPFP